jgi:hypothetical protein
MAMLTMNTAAGTPERAGARTQTQVAASKQAFGSTPVHRSGQISVPSVVSQLGMEEDRAGERSALVLLGIGLMCLGFFVRWTYRRAGDPLSADAKAVTSSSPSWNGNGQARTMRTASAGLRADAESSGPLHRQ